MNGREELTVESEDEFIARAFHEAYERLAPQFGYRTREASAVPWEDVPQANRDLMVATAASVKHVVLARHVRETGCEGLREAALAYRDLTVCYRTSKTPSEALFRRLAKADAALTAREEDPK